MTTASSDGLILLPYQRRWVNDPSAMKIWLAARQIGKSFALAMEAVRDALCGRSVNLLLSASERQSRELMKKVRMHLEYMSACSGTQIRAGRETAEEIELGTGSRIICLPASPDTVRGFTGNVYLDEFAFQRDPKEIWRAMYPAVTRGYKVRITSTPNGKQNMYYDLWAHDARFSRHSTNVYEAIADGLKLDLNRLREGISDADAWAQEYECMFLDESTALITLSMIADCTHEDATCDMPAGYAPQGELYLGVDIGRKRDLTVFWALERVGDLLVTRMVHTMRNAPFRAQREYLNTLMSVRGMRRACIDSSGIGAQLAEEAQERFGTRVEPVLFTAAVKEDLAVTMRRLFEERGVRVPGDDAIRRDLHAIRRIITPSGNLRFDAGRSEGSHADRFWALALAAHGAGTERVGIAYESIARAQRRTGCY